MRLLAAERQGNIQELTNSELQTFRSCPRKWGFRYEAGLRSRREGRAASFGTLVHIGKAAAWRAAARIPSPRLVTASEAARQAIVDAHQAAEREANEYADLPDLETALWVTHNALHARRDLLERAVVLFVEQPFSVRVRKIVGPAPKGKSPPFRSPDGKPYNGLRHQGQLDLLVYDPLDRAVVLVDHKTTANDASSIERRLRLDTQTPGYLHAARVLLEELAARDALPPGVPKDVHERTGQVQWWVMRSKMPSTPKVLKSGLVSTDKRQDTTADRYHAALQAQIRSGHAVTEDQEALLRELADRPQRWFSVVEHFLSEDEIDDWRRELLIDAYRMRQAANLPVLQTRNPGNCAMPWSMPCEYRSVCLDDTPENRAAFRVSPLRHEEIG